MLKEIIKGQEKARVVLIEDSLSQSGVPVLKAFIHALHKRVTIIHLVLYEGELRNILQGLDEDTKECVRCHDIATDPLVWNGNSTLNMDTDVAKYITQLLPSDAKSEKCAVIFDSISRLMLHHPVSYACQVLQRLSRESSVEQVVSLVHKELHSNSHMKLLHHTCDTLLTLCPPSSTLFHGICSLVHLRPSGKVIKLKEQYTISSDFSLVQNEEIINISETVTAESLQCDPTANLTFSLTLTDKEKDARKQLVLPYVQDKQKLDVAQLNPAGEGKIFYQPDDADDFDEEDPDDDLDI